MAEPWITAELQILISAEKFKGISPNFNFAGQGSVAASKELQEQKRRKRWLVPHYGEPGTTATDSGGQDRGDLYALARLLCGLPRTLSRGQGALHKDSKVSQCLQDCRLQSPWPCLWGKHLSYVVLFLHAHTDALSINQQGGRSFVAV